MLLYNVGRRQRLDEIVGRVRLIENNRGVGGQRKADGRHDQPGAPRRVEDGLCFDLPGRFARILRLRSALLVESIIGSDGVVRRRRSSNHTRVSGKGLRRKYALDSYRIRSL